MQRFKIFCKRTKMTLGIIGALPEEIAPLLAHYKEYETIEFGGNTFYKIQLAGKTAIIARSRIGKVHSALTASSMVLHFGCEKIVFNGIAGAINPAYKVGDLLFASKLCQHDVDLTIFGYPYGFIPESETFTKSDSALNEIVKQVANELGFPIYEGIIASGDQFVNQRDKKQWIRETFQADAVEMEGASVAVVCANLKVPFCILRTISDSVNDEELKEYNEEESGKRNVAFVIKMIEKI